MAQASGRRSPRPAPLPHRLRLLRDDRPPDDPAGAAHGGEFRLLARLHDALAAHGAAHAGRESAPRGRAPARRPPLQGRGVARERGLRLHQAELFAHCPLHPADGARRRGPLTGGGAQGGFLHPPVHRRDEPEQFPPHQSGGAAAHHRDAGGEPDPGPAQPAHRSRARPRRAPHQDDRHGGIPARREHCGDAGQGHLRERAHAAHPVCARHRDGAQAPAPHRAALDQQVLHPRPPPPQQFRPLGGGAGAHRVRDLLGQSR